MTGFIQNAGHVYKLGIDLGSTTAKVVLLDSRDTLLFSDYRRHNTKIYDTLNDLIVEIRQQFGNFDTTVCITGSAGMGVSEASGFTFVQEIIAQTEVVKRKYPQVRTLVDIGGEDSKMIFFKEGRIPDIRMNGSCAGGTGAFIDQTATLLNMSLEEFNAAAKHYTKIYPVASRCGVFAKTDIQNLLSRKVSTEDIAASVFHAVAVQTINTLARGYAIEPKIMLTGGPFSFLPELTNTFIRDLKIAEHEVIVPDNPALMPAIGAALSSSAERFSIDTISEKLKASSQSRSDIETRLNPLFASQTEFDAWNKERMNHTVPRKRLSDYDGVQCFLGIDSGSTTTKISLISKDNELLFNFYQHNFGLPLETLKKGLIEMQEQIQGCGQHLEIARSAVTGYGEDLIKAAFAIDTGIVETIAHYEAAKFFNKNVSFIMDIGGQDMKAVFIENGVVSRIELNEACSAGCGSFIENFSNALGHKVSDFADMACNATNACDLGTRCTVFMNSKVKQALRENASTGEIAAGLSVSVIKNALYKVLKIKNIAVLGDNIVVQGGAFRNPSVHKALEDHIGKRVICTNIPEQMGAFGAACVARNEYFIQHKTLTGFSLQYAIEYGTKLSSKQVVCRACDNLCSVSVFKFSGTVNYYSGNKCEKVFSNKGTKNERGVNLFEEKYNAVFAQNDKTKHTSKLKIGIPRALNQFENFPFWYKLLASAGIEVVLSSGSTVDISEKGKGTIMSDSICFPAKLVHGHIFDLIEKQADRILYPTVMFEENKFENADNSYNCPIVSSYAEVISSAINPERTYKIPVDSPVINFNNKKLAQKVCVNYLNSLGISTARAEKSYAEAVEYSRILKEKLRERGQKVIDNALKTDRTLVVLAGRPYHIDPLLHQKTPDILADFGVDVIPEDLVPAPKSQGITDLHIISQWSYPNRIYSAAQWVAEQPENVQFVQLNSFGCGPDSIVIDECVEILKAAGKTHTLIKVDEISSTGSVRLRLRSMLESLKLRENTFTQNMQKRTNTAVFEKKDKAQRTILMPFFAEAYSDLLPTLFEIAGYKAVNLPKPTKQSVEYGLKYSNNEICYPCTLVVGDVLKYLTETGQNHNEIAVGITQTGGQCRASTYLSLIKKAMISAGYEHIPVISVGTAGKTINPQPGFEINWKKLLPVTFTLILFADSIAKLYYATVPREKVKGSAKQLMTDYIENVKPLALKNSTKEIYELLKRAVADFNNIEIRTADVPKIGLVGEIYIKYNSFGQSHVVDWLINQGVEVIVPPILDFFTQEFVNISVNRKNNLVKAELSELYFYYMEFLANRQINKVNKILSAFKLHRPFHNIRQTAKKAEDILNLVNQFGEGWLIPAEISKFSETGVHNVISVQPFGCIANQIVSKGIEKRLKEKYPNLNLLFLDFDSGVSEVNILNRLHFLVSNMQTL